MNKLATRVSCRKHVGTLGKMFCLQLALILLIETGAQDRADAQERPASNRSTDAFVYQGKLIRPDGKLVNGSLSATIKIFSPEPSECLLWAETQTVVAKNGSFAIEVGYAENRISGPQGGSSPSFREVFINHPGMNHANSSCRTGTSYAPGFTDDRVMSAVFLDAGTTVSVDKIPIKSVPFAKQALEVGGYGISNLVKISGSGSSVVLSPEQMTTLNNITLPGAYFDFGSKRLSNLADPSAASDAATMGWVQSQIGSLGSGTVTSVGVAGAPLSITNGTSNAIISMTQANGTQAGFLSSADWMAFNNKQPAGAYLTGITGPQVTAALGYTPVNRSGDTMIGTLNLPSNGLSVGSNQLVVSGGNIGLGTTSPGAKLEVAGQIKITGGSPGAGKVLQSDASGLASWVTLGGSESTAVSNIGTAGVGVYKQMTGSTIELKKINAGSSSITITDDTFNNELDIDLGNLSVSTGKIVDDAVTFDKLQNVASGVLLGRSSVGSGSVEQLTLGSGLSMSGSVLSTTNSGTVTQISSTNSFLSVANGTSTPSLTLNVGTTSNTVAAGDDSRIAGALQRSGGTMTGSINMGGQDLSAVGNLALSNDKHLKLGSFSADPSTAGWGNAEKGRAWFNTTSNQMKYWDGSAVQALGVSGAGLTSVNGQSGSTQTFASGTTGSDFGISSSGNVHTFNIPSASSSARGLLSAADWAAFNSKQPAGAYLTGITGAMVNTALGFTPQSVLGFTPVSNALPSNQTYIGNGSNVAAAGFFGVGHLRNSSGTAQFPASCTASQTLTWSAVTDVFSCTNIAISSSNITDGSIATIDLADDAVSFAKLQNVSSDRILGRSTAGSGNVEEITLGTGLSLSGGTLTATGSGGTVTSVGVGGLPLSVVNGSSTPTISIAQANGSQAGYLSAADWASFNNKQPAGAYLTGITGAMVNTALGFTPQPAGSYLSSISGSNVNSALGYTPVNKAGDTMTGTLNLPSNGLSVGSSQLVVSGGNIGLGTTSPGAKLEVAGQIKITGGTPGAGKVLQSDASGLASWVTPAPGADNLGGHTATQDLNLSTFKLVGDGGTQGLQIDSSGQVGIGRAPSAKVHVQGQIVSAPFNAGSSTTIDWANGNVQYTSANCQDITFSNMLDGGSYTLIVTGASSGTCSFSQSSPDSVTAGNFKFYPANSSTTGGTVTSFSFLRYGNNVLVSWISGYQ